VVEQTIISFTPILKRPPVSAHPSERVRGRVPGRLTVFDHIDIFSFCWASEGVTPYDIQALAVMKTAQLLFNPDISFIFGGKEVRNTSDSHDKVAIFPVTAFQMG
jgi:hypothetical protein